MKKILCAAMALTITASYAVSAAAADKANGEPDVYVDGSRIMFSDVPAKIVDDVTLVPARGVFEAMGNKVEWNDADRTVSVTSSTGVRTVLITIDGDIMKVSTFKSVFEKTSDDITLEVAAQIIDDRTMIPLRAVSEAFDCDVQWDGEAYAVNITTGDPILLEGSTYEATPESEMVTMSLSTDAEAVAAGDEFTVYVDVANVPDNSYVSGVVATFGYDKDLFEYVEGSGTLLGDDGEPTNASVSAENVERQDGAKAVFVTINKNKARTTDGHVFKATLKKLSDGDAEIVLNDDYYMVYTYNSYLMFTDNESEEMTIYSGKKLALDRTPLVIR